MFSESKFGPPVAKILGSSLRRSAMSREMKHPLTVLNAMNMKRVLVPSILFISLCDPSFYLQKNCNKETCREDLGSSGENKAVNCEISCCETDKCNMVASKGQVSSISILGLIISLLFCYSLPNFWIFISFSNTYSSG